CTELIHDLHICPTRRSSDLSTLGNCSNCQLFNSAMMRDKKPKKTIGIAHTPPFCKCTNKVSWLWRSCKALPKVGSKLSWPIPLRSEEHTSELQSRENLVCRL